MYFLSFRVTSCCSSPCWTLSCTPETSTWLTVAQVGPVLATKLTKHKRIVQLEGVKGRGSAIVSHRAKPTFHHLGGVKLFFTVCSESLGCAPKPDQYSAGLCQLGTVSTQFQFGAPESKSSIQQCNKISHVPTALYTIQTNKYLFNVTYN